MLTLSSKSSLRSRNASQRTLQLGHRFTLPPGYEADEEFAILQKTQGCSHCRPLRRQAPTSSGLAVKGRYPLRCYVSCFPAVAAVSPVWIQQTEAQRARFSIGYPMNPADDVVYLFHQCARPFLGSLQFSYFAIFLCKVGAIYFRCTSNTVQKTNNFPDLHPCVPYPSATCPSEQSSIRSIQDRFF